MMVLKQQGQEKSVPVGPERRTTDDDARQLRITSSPSQSNQRAKAFHIFDSFDHNIKTNKHSDESNMTSCSLFQSIIIRTTQFRQRSRVTPTQHHECYTAFNDTTVSKDCGFIYRVTRNLEKDENSAEEVQVDADRNQNTVGDFPCVGGITLG
jgi:hypothetical protein